MAHDDRYGRRTEWRGDPAFGRGWGNQAPRAQRLGDRERRPADDPYADAERYGGGASGGLHAGDITTDPEAFAGGIGYDAEFAGGPRFDRADVGSTGTHGVHPVSSPFSPAYRGGYGITAGSSARDYAIAGRSSDPHYVEWRRRELDELDRDYEEYHREKQAHFDREFGAWRTRRGEQRAAVGRVKEHMEVLGSDDGHVGTVDCTRGDHIVLTRSDPSAGGIHHSIPCGWIDRVDDKVRLNLTAEEARERWRSEDRSRALFEREDSGTRGPHMLNRSFAGTYPDEK